MPVPVRTSGYPDWVLLHRAARISDDRNETTAECRTSDGQAVQISFWLVDPPAVSSYSVHCPLLLQDDDFHIYAYVICAEGPFVLFSLSLTSELLDRSSDYHLVYYAAGPRPSLHFLPEPEPEVKAFHWEHLGILPCGGGHYVVTFVDRSWMPDGECWGYEAYVFSSSTRSWSSIKLSLSPSLSDADKALLDRHYICRHTTGSGGDDTFYRRKQITIGADSLGWADLTCGIFFVCNLFDEHPVIKFMTFPAIPSSSPFPNEGKGFELVESDVTGCGDGLIKFVRMDLYPHNLVGMSGRDWQATTWSRKLWSWDDWRRNRCTVDVEQILVDYKSYSDHHELLMDDKTKKLNLKNVGAINPTLGVQDDGHLYMLAKVNLQDEAAWVVDIDMKRAVLKAMVPISTLPFRSSSKYNAYAFPKYYSNNNSTAETEVVRHIYATSERSQEDRRWIYYLFCSLVIAIISVIMYSRM